MVKPLWLNKWQIYSSTLNALLSFSNDQIWKMQQDALTRTLVLRKKMIWCVFDYASTNIQTASEVVHLLVVHECVSKVLMGEKGLRLAYQRYLWNVPSWRGASARCDPSRTVCSCPRHASSSGGQGEGELVFAAGLESITREKSDFQKSKAVFVHCIVLPAYPPGVHKMQFRNFRQGKECKFIFFPAPPPELASVERAQNAINGLIIHRPATLAAKITWKETTLASNKGWNRAE